MICCSMKHDSAEIPFGTLCRTVVAANRKLQKIYIVIQKSMLISSNIVHPTRGIETESNIEAPVYSVTVLQQEYAVLGVAKSSQV